MRRGHVAQRGGELADVALDDDVELVRHATEQQVAHGAADEVHAVAAGCRVQQPPPARELAEALEQIVHRDSLPSRPDRPGAGPIARRERRTAPVRSLP